MHFVCALVEGRQLVFIMTAASVALSSLGCCTPQRALKRGTSGRTELSAAETSVVGAMAGAVTGLVTTPLDVIKTRLMTQGASGRYKGVIDCATKIARQEGISTFFTVSPPCPTVTSASL